VKSDFLGLSDSRIIATVISWSNLCYKVFMGETVALSPRTESIVHGEVEIIVMGPYA
jgi:hypothetical protein